MNAFIDTFMDPDKNLSDLIYTNVKSSWAVPDYDKEATKRQNHIDSDNNDHRTPFQHDVARIIHSKSFRRLKHKTQVFISYEEDHFRTRLTHTLEVAQLSTSVARTLGLNEDLTQAIALGHDLGHTPFGHAGEMTLNNVLKGENGHFNKRTSALLKKMRLGFKHNEQSVRIVDNLDDTYKGFDRNYPGLNLTKEVKEGILKHTKIDNPHLVPKEFLPKNKKPSVEGQVVAICDEISQVCH